MSAGTPGFEIPSGRKFDRDGGARPFPGISVICFLEPGAPQREVLLDLQAAARRAPFGRGLACLPPESFHMTVADLMVDQERSPEHWSSKLEPDAPFESVRSAVEAWLDGLLPAEGFRMDFSELGARTATLAPLLKPADEGTRERLAALRDRIAERTGVRHPGHDAYRFHVSAAYILEGFDRDDPAFRVFLKEWDDALARSFGTLRTGPPKLVYFPDMLSYA